jgi:sorting nexin-27
MTSALTVEDNDRTDVRIEENERAPRTATVIKTEHGFGFNVRGQVAEGGQLKSIGGQLYAPMQYISAVMKDGPAEKAGLHIGDRIVEVNGQSVEGADHQTVVQMIRQSGKQVKLTVISVSEDEARRLEPESSSSTTAGPGVEYYERRSVPVSVPEFEKLMENGKEYVVSEYRHKCGNFQSILCILTTAFEIKI